jgi:3-phenylpropionate/trans-cinnamate dioxygenase ferredoxin subunit
MPFVKAIAKSEIQPNKGRCVTVAGKTIAIFNVDGQYLAIDDKCTHADASLADGPISKSATGRCVVECPWHGAQFDLKTGDALTRPAVTGVKAYPVRVAGDALEVEI